MIFKVNCYLPRQ